MKRALLLLTAVLLPAVLGAQTADLDRIAGADFSPLLITETPPDSLSVAETVMYTVNKQLTGRCYFDPPCYLYFGQAVRTLGPVSGTLSTLDHIIRCSRIGTARIHFDPTDPYIHEGPEAYLPERRRR